MKTLGSKSLSSITAMFINILWWIEWIGFIVTASIVIITPFFHENISMNVPVTFSQVSLRSIDNLTKSIPDGQLMVTNGTFFFNISPSFSTTLILLTLLTLLFSILISITYQLKTIFSNLKRNDLFNEINISGTRNIGIILIISSVLHWIFNFCMNQFLISQFNWGNGIALTYTFNLGCMITGVILIIAAEVVRQGLLLEEENKLTI